MVSESEDDDDDVLEVDTAYLKAYKKFMIAAMKVLANNTDSKVELEAHEESFQKAADIYVKMSKVIKKVGCMIRRK